MWIISVEPMPSMISMPVACLKSWRVASGSASPAETHFLSEPRSKFFARPAIARYMVGAEKNTVALKRWIVSSSVSGESFSTSTVDAPTRIGKASIPPRPKVKAIGGVPQKMSSFDGMRQERGKASHIAITSRWKCIVPLGLPVVPEVKAMSATSSAAVSTLRKVCGWRRHSASRESGASSYQYLTAFSVGQAGSAASSSPARRLSQSAWLTSALVTISVSSLARSKGIVATHTPPAFITANQQAAIIGLFGPRNSTRLPGLRPISRVSTLAMRFACA